MIAVHLPTEPRLNPPGRRTGSARGCAPMAAAGGMGGKGSEVGSSALRETSDFETDRSDPPQGSVPDFLKRERQAHA